jgi:hypothetical protein
MSRPSGESGGRSSAAIDPATGQLIKEFDALSDSQAFPMQTTFAISAGLLATEVSVLARAFKAASRDSAEAASTARLVCYRFF